MSERVPIPVIVGARFAGLSAAEAPRRAPVRFLLIDRTNHHLFQPLLYQAATSVLSPPQIASPIREIAKLANFYPVHRLRYWVRVLPDSSELPFAGFAEFAGFARFTGSGPYRISSSTVFSAACKWQSSCNVLDLEMVRSGLRRTVRALEAMDGLNRKPKMSCRIDRVVSAESLVVLSISGRITGEHVDMLRGVLEQESGGFAIDLKNVLLVGREAVRLLALREANGTELRNCPAYIREWVTRERVETKVKPALARDGRKRGHQKYAMGEDR